MKLGIYGGSFDPIHAGHIEPVRYAVERFELDRVIYLPTAQPPHKPGREMAPAHARFVMTELALLADPRCRVSPLELTFDRPAYTIDSLEHFAAERPEARLFLILGDDSYADLESWRRWRELFEMATVLVLARPEQRSHALAEALSPALARRLADGRAVEVGNPPVEVSATQLRRRLAAGHRPPEGSIPDLVLDYARKYRLYR